jgi:hypothetical protein
MEPIQFEPERWHACNEADWLACKDGVNCYSYLLNRPDYYWSVPGEGFVKAQTQEYFKNFDKKFKNISLNDFREHLILGAIKDGLTPIEVAVDKDEYYLAVLFYSDSEKDFHWYRKDDNGFWSHKNGREAASNVDDDGRLITNPLQCANPLYPIFGGFFLVPKAGIQLNKESSFPQ